MHKYTTQQGTGWSGPSKRVLETPLTPPAERTMRTVQRRTDRTSTTDRRQSWWLFPDGRDELLAGQKSGIVYALDPSRKGEVLWQVRVGKGGLTGGVQWGMASDGQRVYAAVSDAGRTRPTDPFDVRRYIPDPSVGGGLTALRIVDGSTAWRVAAAPCSEEGASSGCSPAQPAAVTAIPGCHRTTPRHRARGTYSSSPSPTGPRLFHPGQ